MKASAAGAALTAGGLLSGGLSMASAKGLQSVQLTRPPSDSHRTKWKHDHCIVCLRRSSQRIKKTTNGQTNVYVGTHKRVAIKYIMAGGLRIVMIVGGEDSYFHKDHLGSTTAITDYEGLDVENREYLPFGGDRVPGTGSRSHYQFTDQEKDGGIGLYNYKARLYDPSLGIFISADSIVPRPEDPQALNRYSYVRNNPMIYIDPTGHSWLSDLTGIHIRFNGGFRASINLDQFVPFVYNAMLFYIAGSYIDYPIEAAVASGEYATASAAIEAGVGYSSLEQAAIHAGAGAFSGATNGGDVGLGMLTGAVSAGFGKYIGVEYLAGEHWTTQFIGYAATGSFTGGISSKLYGGSFEDGLYLGFKTSAYGFWFNQMGIVDGVWKAMEGLLNSTPVLTKGLEFGFKAAGEVSLDVAWVVGVDTALACVPNSKYFPLLTLGNFAFGRSSAWLMGTYNFATAGPNAVLISNRIQRIQNNVFNKQ